jgi:hypothetical protein
VLNKTSFAPVYYHGLLKLFFFFAELCNLLSVINIISPKQERRVYNYYIPSSDVFLLYKLCILKLIKRSYFVNLVADYFFPQSKIRRIM